MASALESRIGISPTGTQRACFHWQTNDALTFNSRARLLSERRACFSAFGLPIPQRETSLPQTPSGILQTHLSISDRNS